MSLLEVHTASSSSSSPSSSSSSCVAVDSGGSVQKVPGGVVVAAAATATTTTTTTTTTAAVVDTDDAHGVKKKTSPSLGWFSGCFIPYAVSTMGVVLFSDLGWGVGTIGTSGAILILVIGDAVCALTLLSLAALLSSANDNASLPKHRLLSPPLGAAAAAAGGGGGRGGRGEGTRPRLSYVEAISKHLGDEIGLAFCAMLFITYVVFTAFCCVAFAEGLENLPQLSALVCDVSSLSTDGCVSSENFNRIAGTVAVLFCCGVASVSSGLFRPVTIVLFCAQCVLVVTAVVSFLIPANDCATNVTTELPQCALQQEGEACDGLVNLTFPVECTGLSNKTAWTQQFLANWPINSHYPSILNMAQCPATESSTNTVQFNECSFGDVFTILFPAVPGILEGANLHSMIRDPASSIPKGTFAGMLFSTMMYFTVALTMAGSFSTYSLMYDPSFWNKAAWPDGLSIVVGSILSSLSAGFVGFFSASRVLRDALRNALCQRAKCCHTLGGSCIRGSDEPHFAMLATAILALIGIAIADLGSVSGLVVSGFLTCYIVVNATCFFLFITRPQSVQQPWKRIGWPTPLLGTAAATTLLFWLGSSVWGFGMAVLVTVAVPAVTYNRWAAAKLRRKQIEASSFTTTMELLEQYLPQDNLAEALIPAGSVDFGPQSVCIAQGAGGRVFKCTAVSQVTERMKLQQHVALKELFSMLDLVNDGGVDEFAKELAVLMQLRHPHIIRFLGIYFHLETRDGHPMERYFMVTQFAENGALDRLMSDPQYPAEQRLRWTREITEAVHYLHRESIVHRDIKPQNILVDENWQCLLTDFGLSRSILPTMRRRELTTRVGTLQYMPPESLNGLKSTTADDVDPAELRLAKAWDVYSFGVLVATLFNFQDCPYPDLTDTDIVVGVLTSGLRPNLPTVLSSEFNNLLTQLWATRAEDRPSMTYFLDSFDALANKLNDDPAKQNDLAQGPGQNVHNMRAI